MQYTFLYICRYNIHIYIYIHRIIYVYYKAYIYIYVYVYVQLIHIYHICLQSTSQKNHPTKRCNNFWFLLRLIPLKPPPLKRSDRGVAKTMVTGLVKFWGTLPWAVWSGEAVSSWMEISWWIQVDNQAPKGEMGFFLNVFWDLFSPENWELASTCPGKKHPQAWNARLFLDRYAVFQWF